MPRTTTLHFTKADTNALANRLCADHALGYDVTLSQIASAIGHLSLWASDSDSYTLCRIFVSPKRNEITAAYYDGTGPDARNTFVLGAVWNPTTSSFSFHS